MIVNIFFLFNNIHVTKKCISKNALVFLVTHAPDVQFEQTGQGQVLMIPLVSFHHITIL